MRSVLILAAALFTVATAWAFGAILLRKLSLKLYRAEERLFALIVGSACLSSILFALAAFKVVHRGVLIAVGIAAIGYAIYSGAYRSKGAAFPPLPSTWKWAFLTVFAAFSILYFFNALAPEISPDGAAYHLGEVAKYYRAHGFVRITTNIYGNLSQGMELLFLFAFTFGKHSAAALVHYAFFVTLTLLIVSYGRRLGHPKVGIAGAIILYCSPLVGMDGTIAYIDVGLAAIAFALFYLLQIWDQDRVAKLLVPIGILAGFAFAIKYTAFLAIPYTLCFIAWKQWKSHRRIVRPVLITAGLALVMIAPWLVKNWIWVNNPVSPFANRLFPNPYVHIAFEEDYRKAEQNYGLTDRRQIPWQITVKGEFLAGFYGPLFLLTPLSLLALRRPAGRQLWLAALVFGLPYYANIGARFLIPAAPFISLALAFTFANAPDLMLVIVLAHAITCWPSVAKRYCASSAWRINDIPLKAALRIEPEEEFLSRRSMQYVETRMIERLVPPGERVFAFGQMADSYSSHEILVSFQGALNETLRDILWTPLFSSLQPMRVLAFRFPSRELGAIRVVQTEKAKDVQWGVIELRVWNGGNELPRAPIWRLSARPNPWDVQMAFDNSPVTRWRSAQVAEPGMYVQVDFGRNQSVSGVTVESSDEGYQTKVRLEGRDAQGNWATVLEEPVETVQPTRVDLRGAATSELKARGIRYIIIEKGDFRSEDFGLYANLWGMKCIGAWKSNAFLYHIE